MNGEFRKFVEVAFPPGSTPQTFQITKDGGANAFTRDVEQKVSGKRWDELTIKDVFSIREELVHFTEQALHYYLAAFLIFALNPSEEGQDIAMYLEFFLAGDDGELWPQVLSLDTAQKSVISRYLELQLANGANGITPQGLAAYSSTWHQFSRTEKK